MSLRCIFYLDMGARIGFGHAGRCRILAAALAAAGIRCLFKGVPQEAAGFLAPFATTPDLAPEDCDIAVVDSYRLPASERRHIRGKARRLLVIDDFAHTPGAADVLLNHNLYAADLDYSSVHAGKVLLGPRYALVDPALHGLRGYPPRERQLVITFGLSDLAALLLDLAPALARTTGWRVDAVVPDRLRRKAAVAEECPQVRFLSPDALHRLFAPGELLVTGLGVTYLEALATGRRVLGVRLVDNQEHNWRKVRQLGLPVADAPTEGELLRGLEQLRQTPAAAWQRMHALVDGRGAQRVAREVMRGA